MNEIFKKKIINFLNGFKLHWSSKTARNKIAITFDDGPDENYTALILEILKKHQIKSTFFLVGKNIEQNIELVSSIVNDGHEVGNHTFSHMELRGFNWGLFKQEIKATDQILKKNWNLETPCLRLPKGRWNFQIILILLMLKKKIIFWNVDPRDYRAKSKKEIICNLNNIGLKSGDIILLHDNNQHTARALPDILKNLKNRGLRPVTISELLGE